MLQNIAGQQVGQFPTYNSPYPTTCKPPVTVSFPQNRLRSICYLAMVLTFSLELAWFGCMVPVAQNVHQIQNVMLI